jgi:pilus assembly protein TadC
VEEVVEGKPSLSLRLFVSSCRAAGKWVPLPPGKEGRLGEALEFLGLGVEGREVRALALLSSLLFFLLSLPLALLLPWTFFLPFLSPLVYLGVKGYPVQLAEGERRRRVGEAPRVLCSLSAFLLLHPNPEVAAEFAAENAEGRMARDLGRELSKVLLRVHREAGEALESLSRRWGDPPELRRSLPLLLASVRMGEEDRRRAVEGALELSLEEVRERVREFVGWVRFPLLLLYSFGVLLPLCLLTLLPVMASLGFLSSPLPLAALYCFFLPLGGYLLSSWILSRRPGVSPPREFAPRQGRRHLLPFLPLSLLSLLPLLPLPEERMLAFLWAVVLALSLHLFLTSRGEGEERRRLLELEENFPEALQELGSELRGGKPMEEALRRVAATHRGWGELVAGRAGESSSGLVKGTLSLLRGLAERSGRAAGEAALRLSSHLRRLKEVERRGRQEMAELSSSMRSVALFFFPLIASLTCQMYAILWGRGTDFSAGAPSPALLLLLLGMYTLAFSSLLLSLVSEVEEGGDQRVKRDLLASGLPLCLSVFTLGTVGGRMLLGWLT